LWQAGHAPPQRAVARNGKVASNRASRYCFTIAQKGVTFSTYSGKLSVHYPCILQELELARNIGVETDEM
jgi:hypothetical protein